MISRDYCVVMARYNRWQNKQLEEYLQHLDHQELTRDRKAFFGSILGTINHLLWGDLMWMSRFSGSAPPAVSGKDSSQMFPTLAAWSAERFRADGHIRLWADGLQNVDLAGNLTWFSGSTGQMTTKPLGMLVVHFFNHQTHHRGQVHAMLTATGSAAPVSDLAFMPESF